MNQIQKTYRKHYIAEPSHYLIVKYRQTLLKGNQAHLSMAMEQGLTLLFARGDSNHPLNIQVNHCSEIVLQNNGNLINAEHEETISNLAKKAISLGVDDLSLNKLNGGCLYLHYDQPH